MTKGRVFAIIIVTLVLALMIGLFVTGMTRGAAWVLDVEDVPRQDGNSSDDGVNVNIGGIKVDVEDDKVGVDVGGLDVDVGDGKVKVHLGGMNEEDRAAFANWLDDLGDVFSDNGGFSMFNFNFGTRHNWGSEFKNGTIVTNGSVEIGADDVKGINANWIGGRMTIKTHSSSEILLEQTCKSGSIPEDRRLVYRMDGGKLVLREGAGRMVSSRTTTDLVIYLPEDFAFIENVELNGISTDIVAENQTLTSHDDIEVSVVSGNVNLDGADSEGSIKLDSTSGDLTLNNCRAQQMVEADTTSGNVRFSEVRAGESMEMSTTSGDVYCEDSRVGQNVKTDTTSGNVKLIEVEVGEKIEAESTSGDVYCENVTARKFESSTVSGKATAKSSNISEADCSSTSGDIAIESRKAMSELRCNSISGSVSVTLPTHQSGFTAKYDTISGDFRCDFATTSLGKHEVQYGDGSANIYFDTTSGDMRIIKG